MKTKNAYNAISHAKRVKFITELKEVVIILACSVFIVVMIGIGIEYTSTRGYQEFQDNYEECLVADNFTQEQCYDIAYATALGE